jgi:hypothetical protein
MYYPFLRGRQFELIALREFSQSQSKSNNEVIPIIEPVRDSFNSLKIAFDIFKENDFRFALVLNPEVGELQDKNVLQSLDDLLPENFVPALHVKNNSAKIIEIIKQNNLKNVMLLLSRSTDITKHDFYKLLHTDDIAYIVTEENKSLRRKCRKMKKKVILLEDCFEKQNKSSDYLGIPEQKYTEENIFYKEDGYAGYADYAGISSEYSEGGTLPYAVSIHLTYKKSNGEIWIKHFTSESNENRENIQGKFAQAAEKAIKFLNKEKIHTVASEELREYYQENKYPGLGMVKKISIKHHIELMNSLI